MNVRRTRPNVTRHPRALRALAAVGLAAVFVAGVAAIRAAAGASAPNAQQTVTMNLLDDPLAKFAKLMPVISHPRCANCHGGSNPFEGINHPANVMLPAVATRLRDANGDHDFANQGNDVCNTCHNVVDTAWVLAHGFSRFKDQTARQVCSLWKTSLHDSAPELLTHLQNDALIKIGFQGNKNINDPAVMVDRPRTSFFEFMGLVRQWLNGATFIPCGGWVGTITQTERVNLTTTNRTVMQSGTETQNATRITEIVIDGTANFRIAVQGTERSNITIVASSGGQSCTATHQSVRVYGTENGVTSGEATTATLTFSPGGAYAVNLDGPDERTVSVERTSGTHCTIGTIAEETDTLKFDHDGWTVSFDGVLPNPADRTILKDSKTRTVTRRDDAWLTHSGGAVTALQTRDNGDLIPVPVEITTTWDLRRRN